MAKREATPLTFNTNAIGSKPVQTQVEVAVGAPLRTAYN